MVKDLPKKIFKIFTLTFFYFQNLQLQGAAKLGRSCCSDASRDTTLKMKIKSPKCNDPGSIIYSFNNLPSCGKQG